VNAEAASPAVTFTIPARDLRDRLLAVTPFIGVSVPQAWPGLACMRIEVYRGTFFFAATDRYALAVASYVIPGSRPGPVPGAHANLAAADAADLARWLERQGRQQVSVTLARSKLRVQNGAYGISCPVDRDLEFPAWLPMLRGFLCREPGELGDGFGLNPKFLARLDTALAGLVPLRGVSLWVGKPAGEQRTSFPIVLAAHGDWFVAAIMPVRKDDADEQPGHQWRQSWAALTAPADTKEQVA
jgi:hypothetical protein